MRPLTKLFTAGSLLIAMAAVGQTNERASVNPSTGQDAIPDKPRTLPGAPLATRDSQGFLVPGADPENRLPVPFLKHLASDQKQFWSSPKYLDKTGAATFAGFLGFTGLLIGSDSWITKQVPDKPNQLKRSQNISNYAVYSLVAAGGSAYLLGKIRNDDHMSETGLLSGEAALNSTALTYFFKAITQRPRPLQDNGNGTLFHGGYSFPSEHSAVAWSIASVVAHEYPGPLTKFLAYGLASTVTLTRVTGKQHFASDAFVGGALGWYLGRQIYRAHHDTEVGGAPWGELVETKEKGPRNLANMGSPYVPLDSWVYPVFEQLAARGYVRSAYLGVRPWTRLECARLVEEAADMIREQGADAGRVRGLYDSVANEFAQETAGLEGARNLGVRMESIYTRTTGISGRPLEDSYHFGQTLINDYGRPYGNGFNMISGLSAYAIAGPLALYVRGEYQRAPGMPSDPGPVLQGIANADLTSPVSNARPAVNRLRLLDAYSSLTFHNTQFSFGRQSLWLGPGEAGPLLFSNNAEPVLMFKMSSVSPYQFPLLSYLLGPVQTEFFLGQLTGHSFEFDPVDGKLVGPGDVTPQPFLQGVKLNFKPTSNLEFGAGATAQFAGPGLPFIWRNFLRTFFSHTASANNPGKRITSVDFRYRVPGIRRWLSVYGDALAVDEYSPIGSTRATVNPGLYMPQIPKIHNLELRAEGLREPLTTEFAPGFVYYGVRRYRSGYTNNGFLLGSWIGRAGQGGQGWLTYSFSPRNKLQFGYRHQEVSKDFIGGGRLIDYSLRGSFLLGRYVELDSYLQYEQWKFPVISPTKESNLTASFQLTFHSPGHARK
jgi:Capsule assembly protein Wzi/PAP2 superfamily